MGSTTVSSGTFGCYQVGVIPTQSALTVAAGAKLAMNTKNQQVGSLAGAGTVDFGLSVLSASLIVGGDNTTTFFTGNFIGTDAADTLTKVGTGLFTLQGSATPLHVECGAGSLW